jgi:ribulose-phosphate 3-epimerase
VTVQVAPSILAADFAHLARDIRTVEDAGAEMIHIDVMDGHFVPNLTVGLPVLEAIRRTTQLHLDVHLMISNPEEMAARFADAGANSVTVHYEASKHLQQILGDLRARGVESGVVLNPHTPVSSLEESLRWCDMVLIMSVNPGYGGQEFIPGSFAKVRKLRHLIDSSRLSVKIEIDGGIGPENASDAVMAGVNVLVAGTAIFGVKDPAAAFRHLRELGLRAFARQEIAGSSTT